MLLVRIDCQAVLQDEVYPAIEGRCWMMVDMKKFLSDKNTFPSISFKSVHTPSF
jgi:hypothetical protein